MAVADTGSSVDSTSSLLDLAQRAWREWDLGKAVFELVSVSENTVFRATTSSGRQYALRIHRPRYHSYEELLSEQTWTAALARAGIGVPVAVATRGGGGYASLPLGDSGELRWVGVVTWIEGDLLSSLLEDADDVQLESHFVALGTVTARLHNQAVSWSVPRGFKRHSLDADGFVGEAPFWGRFWEIPQLRREQRKLLDSTRRRIHAVLEDYGKAEGTYSLIHADLHPDNVVVQGESVAVIDFDDAGFGWHQYELAVALFAYQDDSRFELMREALVSGYRRERPLSEKALRLLPLFLLIRALAILGWIVARPEVDHGDRLPALIERACSQAESLPMHYISRRGDE